MKCNPMILVNHVDTRIDLLDQRVQQETKQLRTIVMFFQLLGKEVDKFAKGYQRVIQTIKGTLYQDNGWGNYLQELLDEHTEIVKNLSEFEATLNLAVIEPLDVFATKYQQKNNNVISKALDMANSVTNKRQYLEKAKKKFFKDSKVAMGCNNEGTYKSKLKIAEEARNEYTQQIKDFNKALEEIKDKYAQHLKSWLVNEECKLNYVKNILSKFNGITSGIGSACMNATKASEKLINEISSTLIIKEYIITPPTKEKVFRTAIFEAPYIEDNEVAAKRKRLMELCAADATAEGIEFVKDSIKSLLKGETIITQDRSKLIEVIKTERGVKAVCKSFNQITRKTELNNYNTFNFVTEIFQAVLDQICTKKSLNSKQISFILELGGLILSHGETESKKIVYLRQFLFRHKVWNTKNIWRKIINYRIKKSFENLRAYMLYTKSAIEEQKTALNTVDWQKQKEQEKVGKRGIASSELGSLALELGLYSVDIEQSREFILLVAKEYEIESAKFYNILLDYETARGVNRIQPQSKDILQAVLGKQKKKEEKYGSLEVLRLSLKYIEDLASLLILNKKTYELLRMPIYKLILHNSKNINRLKIWKVILNDNVLHSLYTSIKANKLNDFLINNKDIDDVICLDVARSFRGLTDKNKDAVISVLRCYAIHNPEVGYCQGMNCIAGLFYILCEDEAIAFMMFASFVKRFGLIDLFKPDMPLLKTYLFALNKLIAIFLPEVHTHLFEENINAAHFSSAWILTSFTEILQYLDTGKIPPLLFVIFDEILTKGLRVVLKASLFIIDYHKEQLLAYKDEKIFQLFNDLFKNNFFFNSKVVRAYKCCRFNITQELLNELTELYKHIHVRSKEYKIDIGVSEKEFKHFICSNDRNRYAQVCLL